MSITLVLKLIHPYTIAETMFSRFSHTVGAIVLLLVWVSTPLLSAVHIALEEHSYCEEHGRLEEGDSSHGSARLALAGADSTESKEKQALAPRPSDPRSSHVGCVFADSFTVDSIRVVTSSEVGKPCIGFLSRWIAGHSDKFEAIPILCKAPKGSPPTIA